MTKEDYVSYEVAKLLKENGFAEPCQAYWRIFENGDRVHTTFAPNENHNNAKGFISMPTHQMVMKWLREIYGLHISVAPYLNEEGEATWVWEIINIETAVVIADSLDLDDDFSSCEEAVEAALKYCLTKLI